MFKNISEKIRSNYLKIINYIVVKALLCSAIYQ